VCSSDLYGQNHRDENTYRSYERERGDSPNAGNDDRRNDWSYRTQPERSDESRHRGGSNESYASYGSGGSSSGEGYGGSGEARFGRDDSRFRSGYGGQQNDNRFGGGSGYGNEQRYGNDQRHGGGFGGGQYGAQYGGGQQGQSGGGQYGGGQYGGGQYGGGQYGGQQGQYGGGQYRNENRYGSNYGSGDGSDRNDRYRAEQWGNEHHAGAGYGNENMRDRETYRPERFGNAYGGGYHSYGEQHGGENRFARYYGRDEGMSGGTNEERNRGMDMRDRQRGPHYGKGPQGFQRSDERIKEMVSEALADHEHLDATNIHVEVKSGEVTLTGTVESRRDKRVAEDCVERVTGVKDVQNQIRVSDASSTTSGNGSKQDMSSSSATAKPNQPKLQH